MSENEIQKVILEYLNALPNCVAWRNNTGSRGGVRYGLCKGSSDIIGCYQGTFLAVEVKDKGKPTEDQLEFLTKVIRNGGIGLVARSVDEVEREIVGWNYRQDMNIH